MIGGAAPHDDSFAGSDHRSDPAQEDQGQDDIIETDSLAQFRRARERVNELSRRHTDATTAPSDPALAPERTPEVSPRPAEPSSER